MAFITRKSASNN